MTSDSARLPEGYKPPRPADAVQSLERGLAIIRAFDGTSSLNLAQISERAALSRSAARRLLLTLVELGYVKTIGKRYELAPSVLWLGYTYKQRVTLRDLCRPHLQILARHLGTSSSVAVLEGGDIRYICRVMAASEFAPTVTEGTRLPAHQTSLGRVLLAQLEADMFEEYIRSERLPGGLWLANFRQDIELTRSRGWSAVDQLMEVGIQAVSVPLRNRDGDIVAALSTATNDAAGSIQVFVRRSVPHVQETARRICLELTPDTPMG
ncbi:IclR family transcriptional regulator domain-containing protein [Arthrobacter crystallopoietes]|uniref:IclR family transcriptional regulator domain-containing protein n=1 Tax=Crystallibacter crystallopoietes TaxID=37928 RepID=UPI0011110329|nr:IclR family transcriptional regulator C-terminal domain-containing protein [Arthrobacter crystallopoietes]